MQGMLNTEGLLSLTEDKQVGWRLIKVEKRDNKIIRDIHTKSDFTEMKFTEIVIKFIKLFYYIKFIIDFNEIYSFKSNFDFEQPLIGTIKKR